MSPTTGAIFLILMTFLLGIAEFLIYPYVKKVTNMYLFWLIISIFLLVYFIVVRYSNDIKNLINYLRDGSIPSGANLSDIAYWKDFLSSKVYLSDLCPFMFVLCNISLICDRSRKIPLGFSYLMFFGSLILLISLILDANKYVNLTWEYIFIGTSPFLMQYMLHAMSFLLAIGVMLNTPHHKLTTLIRVLISTSIYYSWACIVAYAIGIDYNVGGVKPGDFQSGGEFYAIQKIFGSSLGFPGYLLLLILVALIFIVCMVYINFFLHEKINSFKLKDIKANNHWWQGYYQLNH